MYRSLPIIIVALLLCAAVPMPLAAQFDYANFSNTAGLRFVGAATVGPGNTARLTPAFSNRSGALWYATPQLVGNGFVTTFKFKLSGLGGQSDGNANGGDGFALVIQNQSDSAIGFAGGSIGYDGIPRSIAIEFDTWDDGFAQNGDPNGNHVSINTRDTFPNSSDHGYSINSTIGIPNLSDGAVHSVTVQYLSPLLSIYIDNCSLPVLEAAVNLNALLKLDSGRAWIGFTSATMSAWENHDILSWKSAFVGVLPRDTMDICLGDSVTLTVPTVDGDVTWSTGARTPSIRVGAGGVYRVTVRENMGCRQIVYVRNVLVRAVTLDVPVITADRSLDLCEGEVVKLDAGVTAPSYLWSTGARTRTISVATAGDYQVEVFATGCRRVSAPVTVRVFPHPDPLITAIGPTSLCFGDSVTLDGGAGWNKYKWSNGDTTRFIRVGDSASYTVEVSDSGPCPGTSAPFLVRVLREPKPSIVPNRIPRICEGDSVVLSASLGYRRYQWSTGDTGQALVVRTSGTYSVRVFTPEGCNGVSPDIVVTVVPPPVPVVTPIGSTSLCLGDSVTLRAPAGFASYLWTNGSTADSIRVGAQGSYGVTVTDTSGCTGSSQPVDITIGTTLAPVVTAIGATSFCDGDSVELRAPAGYAEYRWTTGDTTASIVVHTSGIFTVAVRSASGCSGSSAPVVVTAFPLPAVPVIVESAGVLSTDPAASWQWYRDGTPIAGATAQTLSAASGEGLYKVRVTDANGCSALSLPYVVSTAGTSFSLPSLSGAPGDHILVPIMLDASHGLNDGRAVPYTAVLRFDAGVLVPAGSTPAGVVTGGQRRVTVTGNRPAGLVIGELTRVELQAVLGTAVATPIVLESFLWEDGGAAVEASIDGAFQLTGICTEGGPRLVDASHVTRLKPVIPNPAGASITVGFELSERGRTRLVLIDPLGATAATLLDAERAPGTYAATFHLGRLAAGAYTLVLLTPTERRVGRVCILGEL